MPARARASSTRHAAICASKPVPRASSISAWRFGSLKTSHHGRSASEGAGAGGPCTSR